MIRMLDMQITSKCNLNCEFCCGTPKGIPEVTFDNIKAVIKKLKEVNVSRIVLTGGEPLLYSHIDELIEYIKSLGIEIYLSTNGYFLRNHIEVIAKNVSCVGLPLDSYIPENCEIMTRKKSQVETTIDSINLLKCSNNTIKIKIGTVVSKLNILDLDGIYNLLTTLKNKPDVWRLYEFSPLGEGLLNREKFEITPELFLNSTEKYLHSTEINVSRLTNKDSNDAYIFLHPNMDIILLTNDKYQNVGNAIKFSSSQLDELFNKENKTLKNQEQNRKWLEKNEYKNK